MRAYWSPLEDSNLSQKIMSPGHLPGVWLHPSLLHKASHNPNASPLSMRQSEIARHGLSRLVQKTATTGGAF